MVLILGTMGSGKSTISHSIIKGADSLEVNEVNNVVPLQPLIYQGSSVFEVGHESVSCTRVPSFYPLDEQEQLFLVDCPGFGDSD